VSQTQEDIDADIMASIISRTLARLATSQQRPSLVPAVMLSRAVPAAVNSASSIQSSAVITTQQPSRLNSTKSNAKQKTKRPPVFEAVKNKLVFHENNAKGTNDMINMELYASYTYMSMACYFDRHDVAMPGFSKYFWELCAEERGHARMLINYQNKRGGRVRLYELEAPPMEWESALHALQMALQLEQNLLYSLLQLRKTAEEHDDPQMSDFISAEFLTEQENAIKGLSDRLTQIQSWPSEQMYDFQVMRTAEDPHH